MLKNRLRAYLIFGCNGLGGYDDFIFCRGVENKILDLDDLKEEEYNIIINFFDNACDLFNFPINDYNKCVNTISLLYKNYNLFDQKRMLQIQSFIKQHKSCGIWLMLILKEDYQNE